MTLSAFDYHLPSEKIAQVPVSPRDSSKLLVVDRKTGQFSDHHFSDLANLLTENDVLVLNNTKVFPARLYGKTDTGKVVELLLARETAVDASSITWAALTKPGLKVGAHVTILDTDCTVECVGTDDYTRLLRFPMHREEFFPFLDAQAHTPIPPYIHWDEQDESRLRELYQTVYAKYAGAVAAPTAGLHFTDALFEKLRAKNVQIEELTLHVGLGTFLPVKTDDIADHHMHAEWYELTKGTADRLNIAKKNGKRIIAVGTTTVRVLETCASLATDHHRLGGAGQSLVASTSSTSIFVYPPYRFGFVDSMITNFHTPKSTLLMLISAFGSYPQTDTPFTNFADSLLGRAYTHALLNKYRFYSFGDAMWIV